MNRGKTNRKENKWQKDEDGIPRAEAAFPVLEVCDTKISTRAALIQEPQESAAEMLGAQLSLPGTEHVSWKWIWGKGTEEHDARQSRHSLFLQVLASVCICVLYQQIWNPACLWLSSTTTSHQPFLLLLTMLLREKKIVFNNSLASFFIRVSKWPGTTDKRKSNGQLFIQSDNASKRNWKFPKQATGIRIAQQNCSSNSTE